MLWREFEGDKIVFGARIIEMLRHAKWHLQYYTSKEAIDDFIIRDN